MISAIIWIWIMPTLCVVLLGLLPFLCLVMKGRWRSGVIKVTKVYYSLFLIFFGFVFVFRKPIYRGKILPGLNHRLFATFAPSNLNEPLFKTEVEPDKELYEFSFQNKYPGFYRLELHMSGRVPQELVGDDLRTKEEVKVYVRIEDGTKVLQEKTIPIHSLSYWSKDSSGMGIYFYRVPSDLSFDLPYRVQIRISGVLKDLVNKYGPVYLVLQRDGDKFRPTFEIPLFNL